jgi:hypothetical protein
MLLGEGRTMRAPQPQPCLTLIPSRKGARSKELPVRWHDSQLVSAARIGRRIGGGTWAVSKIALAMFLDDDMVALAAYQAGDRTSDLVSPYFERFGLASRKVEFLQFSQSRLVYRCADSRADACPHGEPEASADFKKQTPAGAVMSAGVRAGGWREARGELDEPLLGVTPRTAPSSKRHAVQPASSNDVQLRSRYRFKTQEITRCANLSRS